MEINRDIYTRSWIIRNAKEILSTYYEGITLRQLHYRLVAIGMINDTNHYKRVIGAMTRARWENIVDMESFIDRERSMYGETADDDKDLDTEIERGKEQIKAWMNAYNLNRWSNQTDYIEVWIEKKALQGVFERPCMMASVGLAPCKGYPSITFLNEASKRFETAIDDGKKPIILYFGDHDPSGDNIPHSLQKNLYRLGVDVEVIRIALNPDQIAEMGLPGVPPKQTDTRTATWDGDSAVECDAVEPKKLAQMCEDAIEEHFDQDLYDELNKKESDERKDYRKSLKDFVQNMKDGEA